MTRHRCECTIENAAIVEQITWINARGFQEDDPAGGERVFLHGDGAMRRMTPERLLRFRSRWLELRPPGRLHRRAYDLLFRSGLHRPIPYLVYPKRRVARRLRRYLEHHGQGPHTGVRNVYFGHTHRRMSNYHYHGLAFHNGGAPLKGMKFRIIEARR